MPFFLFLAWIEAVENSIGFKSLRKCFLSDATDLTGGDTSCQYFAFSFSRQALAVLSIGRIFVSYTPHHGILHQDCFKLLAWSDKVGWF